MAQQLNKRKNKIYGNCQVYSKNGVLINLCLEERANWYLDRGLAIKKSENPLAIQFLFEAKKEGNVGDDYYLSPKANLCVKCGTDDLEVLTKHHIVPQMYRKFLPENIKSRNSFDICPLCIDDHEKYERYADELKKEIAEKYNAPIEGLSLQNGEQMNQVRAKKYANALLLYGDRIPAEKKDVYSNWLKEYLNKTEIVEQDLKELVDIIPWSRVVAKTHGEIVMSQVTDYQAFVEMWREHFLKYVEPKFMPESWHPKRSIFRD